jgi:hypothetical protein
MPGTIPKRVKLYRIVHVNNLEHLLRYGMGTRSHESADPNYINIGDSSLIDSRADFEVPIDPPNGLLGEYVPFYFGPLSPMLLKIKNGTGVEKREQTDVFYVICGFEEVKLQCQDWCFTDGHAKNQFSKFFATEQDLIHIDWSLVRLRFWKNTEEDFDRIRRKQAEFLVKNHVPVNCIISLVVFNEERHTFAKQMIENQGLNIPVYVNPNGEFYYQ